MDPEPPQPQWLVQSNLLTSLAASLGTSESSFEGLVENNTTQDAAADLFQELLNRIEDIPAVIFTFFLSLMIKHKNNKLTCIYIYLYMCMCICNVRVHTHKLSY